jgi:hypothetical protein
VPRKLTLKQPEIKGCPFRAGDVLRKLTQLFPDMTHLPDRMIVTAVAKIPDIDDSVIGYGDDVKAAPYWFYGTDIAGKRYPAKSDYPGHNGAIWVGFMELDPFLGPAKRAVMEATDA